VSAEHYWARLAPAHAQLERGSSAHNKMTSADIAGATQGLPDGPFYAGLTYLSGVDGKRLQLFACLVRETGCAPGLAHAAIFEMDGGELCRKCNGKGHTAPQVVCDRCLGRRRVKPTAAALADIAGVSRATWYRRHRLDYEEVFALLERWVEEAAQHVARRLRDD
jgi:hypothetical protein